MDFYKTTITETFFKIESFRGTCLVPLVLFLYINISSFSKDQYLLEYGVLCCSYFSQRPNPMMYFQLVLSLKTQHFLLCEKIGSGHGACVF